MKEAKFLETISVLGNDVLIPICRIKHIISGYCTGGYVIEIIADDGEWSESFGKDRDRANKRYEMIKSIIGAPNKAEELSIAEAINYKPEH